MASPWVSPLVTLPTDGQQCWIRLYYFGPPSIAFYRSRDNTFAQIYPDAHVEFDSGGTTYDDFYGLVSVDPTLYMIGTATDLFFGWYIGDGQWEIQSGPPTSPNTTIYGQGMPLTNPFTMSRQDGGPGSATITFARPIPAFIVGRWRPYP